MATYFKTGFTSGNMSDQIAKELEEMQVSSLTFDKAKTYASTKVCVRSGTDEPLPPQDIRELKATFIVKGVEVGLNLEILQSSTSKRISEEDIGNKVAQILRAISSC